MFVHTTSEEKRGKKNHLLKITLSLHQRIPKQSNDYDYDHKEEFRNAGAHEHRCGSHNDIHILL
jgi:hypothetical protein